MRQTSSWPTKQPFVNDTAYAVEVGLLRDRRLVDVEALARHTGFYARGLVGRAVDLDHALLRKVVLGPVDHLGAAEQLDAGLPGPVDPDDDSVSLEIDRVRIGAAHRERDDRALLDLDLHPDLEPVEARRQRRSDARLAHAPPLVAGNALHAQVGDELAARLEEERVNGLTDGDRVEVLGEQALQERRGVRPRDDHEVTFDPREHSVGHAISSRSGRAGRLRRPR